jgi:hypothetical protein
MSDVRNKSRTLLISKLEALKPGSSSQAIALEAAVFEKYGQDTGNEYRDEIRQLSLDLGKNNVELGQQVASGAVSAQEVVNMSNEVGTEQVQRCLPNLDASIHHLANEIDGKSSAR